MNPRTFVVQSNLELHSCVYTVIPVVRYQLLDVPYHLRRLHESALLLNPLLSDRGSSRKEQEPSIASLLLRELDGLPKKSNGSGDGLLTLCWGYPKDDSGITPGALGSFFYPQLPSTMQSSVAKDMVVDLQQYRRQTDPRVKAATWPTERVFLEEKRPKGAMETLIYDDNSTVSEYQVKEGLTSNLFVIEDDCLVTAPIGAALSGSMAHIVLAVAESLGIRVERRCPVLPGARTPQVPTAVPWKTAFLTSATKPIVPITAVLDSAGNTMQSLDTKNDMYHALRYELDSVLGAHQAPSATYANAPVIRVPSPRIPSPWSLPWTHPSFLADVEAMLQHVT